MPELFRCCEHCRHVTRQSHHDLRCITCLLELTNSPEEQAALLRFLARVP